MWNIACYTKVQVEKFKGTLALTLGDSDAPYQPCPCESNKKAKFCCKVGKQWLKQPANVIPPPPISHIGNPDCYASATQDCGKSINREHYISKALLEQYDTGRLVKIAGLQWQPSQQFSLIGIKSLVARTLCERHNSALSPLDSEFSRFARTIDAFQLGQKNSVATITEEFRVFSGLDLERWMLKALLGLVRSGNLSTKTIKANAVDLLYGSREWDKYAGLYVDVGRLMYETDSLSIEVLTDGDSIVRAAKFVVNGLRMSVLLGTPDQPSRWGIRRPSSLVFRARDVDKIIELTWDKPMNGERVLWTRQPAEFDGPPPDWQPWQQED